METAPVDIMDLIRKRHALDEQIKLLDAEKSLIDECIKSSLTPGQKVGHVAHGVELKVVQTKTYRPRDTLLALHKISSEPIGNIMDKVGSIRVTAVEKYAAELAKRFDVTAIDAALESSRDITERTQLRWL
jgi:hypothetical protein